MKSAISNLRRIALLILLLLPVLLTYTASATMQTAGTFIPAGIMTTPRSEHTATLLLNGKVLIAGGTDPTRSGYPSLASAELFNPDTGIFTATGNMTTRRSHHSATLLPDGRVLIAGGGASGTGATAELYDPSTGLFTPTGNMVTAQSWHRATLLNNGKVFITGGSLNLTSPNWPIVANPELYDPRTGRFVATGDYAGRNIGNSYGTWGLVGAPAALLANGKVLIAGEPTAELYDPRTDTFSLTDQMTAYAFSRDSLVGPLHPIYISGRTTTLLPNGNVLLVGGENEDLGWFAAELYDSSIGKFKSIGAMAQPRDYGHALTLLRDGSVLITGDQLHFIGATTEFYFPSTNSFAAAANMTRPRFLHTSTLLMDGRVLVAGGQACCGDSTVTSASTAEIYVPGVPVPASIVETVRFNGSVVAAGSSYEAEVAGSNLKPQMFFDVRFSSPQTSESDVALNWQSGRAARHVVPAGTAFGTWTINGVRAHEIETDHTGSFFPVSATMTVIP
jgi:hypothetical protein